MTRLLRFLNRLSPPEYDDGSRDRRMTCNDCNRHFGVGWRGGAMDFLVSTAIWNYVVGHRHTTVYTIREGFDGAIAPRVEGVGGVFCLQCFDRRAHALGIEYREHLIVFGRDCWMGGKYDSGMPL